jgi:hypothetical protein
MAYTNIDDPSAHFQIALHSSANSATITNDGNSDLQPDLIWSKARGAAHIHGLYDSTRGVTKFLQSNATSAEGTASAGFDLTSFNTNGFSTGNNQFNTICGGTTYAAWQWKANGGTTSSNTDGTVTTTTQVNSDAGFSIVTWAGGGTGTLGHGLGETPDMWIIKNRDYAVSWAVGFSDSNILGGRSKLLTLNTSNAIGTYANLWGTSDAQISSTTIGAAGDRSVNISGNDYVGYFFKAKQGYSKFGKYVGNGSTNGPFVYTGFKPAFVIIKRTDQPVNWDMFTGKISPFNKITDRLRANLPDAENTGLDRLNFISNGFKIINTNTSGNISGGTYIYMAFAENPFVTSTGIPTTAR